MKTHRSITFHRFASIAALAFVAAFASPALAAGDVSVRVSRGSLDVRGDDAANEIELSQTGPTTYVVTGLPGTTVNGGASASFNVRGKIRIRTFGGADRVNVVGPDTPDLTIVTGDGDDIVDIDGVFHIGKVSIDTGDGDDFVVAQSTDFSKKAKIKTGAGDDTIELSSTAFQSKAILSTGTGADTVRMDVVFGGARVDVKLGSGADTLAAGTVTINSLKANGGPDQDTIENGGQNSFTRAPKLKKFEVGSL